MFQTKVVWFGERHKKVPLTLDGVVKVRSRSHRCTIMLEQTHEINVDTRTPPIDLARSAIIGERGEPMGAP